MPDKTQPDLALDALVAEHVLGWTNVHIAFSNVRGVPPGYADKQPPDRTVNFPGLGWSRVISSAWAVVEAMRAKGYLTSCLNHPSGSWTNGEASAVARIRQKLEEALELLQP